MWRHFLTRSDQFVAQRQGWLWKKMMTFFPLFAVSSLFVTKFRRINRLEKLALRSHHPVNSYVTLIFDERLSDDKLPSKHLSFCFLDAFKLPAPATAPCWSFIPNLMYSLIFMISLQKFFAKIFYQRNSTLLRCALFLRLKLQIFNLNGSRHAKGAIVSESSWILTFPL